MNEVKKSYKISLVNLWRTIASIREATLIIIIFIISFVLSFFSTHFLTEENIISTAIGLSADGIITIGMTVALVSGGFDFSVGSIMSLSGVTAGALYLSGLNIWAACLLAILFSIFFGIINGFFIGYIGLNPIIITLAVMGIARGTSLVINQGSPLSIYGVSKSFEFIGQGKIIGIPFMVWIFLAFAIIGDFMMRKSEPLRKVFYTGSNEKAALASGIDTKKVKMGVYILVAALSGVAGILTLSRFHVSSNTLGADESIKCISAAVIGGASLSGGEGTILGAVLGIILLGIINNGLILLNVPVYWQDFINGTILLAVVIIDFVSHKNRLKKYKIKNG